MSDTRVPSPEEVKIIQQECFTIEEIMEHFFDFRKRWTGDYSMIGNEDVEEVMFEFVMYLIGRYKKDE